MAYEIKLTGEAEQHIAELWRNGYRQFGLQIADDYEELILQALEDLRSDPLRPGTRSTREPEGLYCYPLEFAGKRAGSRISKPAHAVFYVLLRENVIGIAAVTRQSRQDYIKNLQLEAIRAEIVSI